MKNPIANLAVDATAHETSTLDAARSTIAPDLAAVSAFETIDANALSNVIGGDFLGIGHAWGNVTHAWGNVTHAWGNVTHAWGNVTHAVGAIPRFFQSDDWYNYTHCGEAGGPRAAGPETYHGGAEQIHKCGNK
jgi:hypothetical protein